MYTIHDERDSSLLRNGLAVGITSLCLLMAGVVLGSPQEDLDLLETASSSCEHKVEFIQSAVVCSKRSNRLFERMNLQLKYLGALSLSLGMILTTGCAGGADKNEGTNEEPRSSVGITFEQNEQITTTGTAPVGDTVGVNASTATNDQVGPSGTQAP